MSKLFLFTLIFLILWAAICYKDNNSTEAFTIDSQFSKYQPMKWNPGKNIPYGVPYNCTRCGFSDRVMCNNCHNCGYCITNTGYGICVEGDEDGPKSQSDRDRCAFYEHTNQRFDLDNLNYFLKNYYHNNKDSIRWDYWDDDEWDNLPLGFKYDLVTSQTIHDDIFDKDDNYATKEVYNENIDMFRRMRHRHK